MEIKRIIGYFLFWVFFSMRVFGQGNPWHPDEDTTKNVSPFWHSKPGFAKHVSGFGIYENNGFAGGMLKFGYGRNHWQGAIDIFSQATTVKWDSSDQNARSSGRYAYWGFGASGRFYMSSIGRNAFVEIGAGSANPRIKVTYADGKTVRDQWKMQYLSFGTGWRFGAKPKGVFGEIGYRNYMIVHRMPLLYTDLAAQPQIGRDAPALQYHIWYIRRFRLNHQVTVGIGYSF